MLGRIIVAILATLVIFTNVLAPGTDSSTISVSVNSITAIDINPATFSFTANPGSDSTPQYYQLENIGSLDITTVTASVTTTNSNPYGSGVASNYNAGEFVRLDNTTGGTFYYVENKNWNESKPLYVTSPSGWSEGSGSSWGYFVRIRSVGLETSEGEEYFAFTINGSTSGCNPGTVKIGKTPHTKSQTGTTDFTGADVATISIPAGGTASLSGAGINTIFDAHTVKVSSDCRAISIGYWADWISPAKSLIGATLKPGAAVDQRIMVSVPYGVVTGTITGTLTVTAS